MNVPTMTMEQTKAEEAYVRYREHLKQRHDEELEMVMKGYKAMKDGHGVLDVHTAIQQAGVNEHGQPMLALVRAHAKEVFYRRERNGSVRFTEERTPDIRARFSVRSFPEDTLPADEDLEWKYTWGRAIVPLIPVQFIPKFGLHNYHILFEAEWQKVPPVDPILLKYLGGTLYAVLAEWDLTPLEQAVLKGRI